MSKPKFSFNKKPPDPLADPTRSLPCSPDIEMGVLSCLLQNPTNTIPHASEHLPPEGFYNQVYRQLYEEILAYSQKNEPSSLDIATFSQWLIDKRLMDKIGGPSFIAELLSFIPTPAHYPHYLTILDHKLRIRKGMVAASDIVTALNSEEAADFDEVAATVIGHCSSIKTAMEDRAENASNVWAETVDTVAQDWTDRYQGKKTSAIPSPWSSWNNVIGGIRKGYNLILGAKKTGKSSLMGHLAAHLSVEQKMRTMIFTYETPVNDYIMRLASNISRVRGNCIFSPDIDQPSKNEIGRISDAMAKIAAAPLKIVKGNGLGVRDIAREAKKFGAFFVVVDYLLLLPKPPEVNQKEGTEGVVRANSCALIDLSRELDGVVAVINHTASSGDRKGESRWGDQPENDADMTLLVERDGITVKSMRNGEAGAKLPIRFVGETYSFQE